MSFRRFSILGLGLIGGSVAMALRKRLSACEITAYDLDGKTLDAALASGAINRIARDPSMACRGAQCIILCVPIAQIGPILSTIAPVLAPGVCVTDVASVKTVVVELARAALPAGVHFVGAHPMAGRELSGFHAASPDLFDGAICLTTPLADTDAAALEGVEAVWRGLGSKIVRLSPQEHDVLVAQISHLPHILASALVNSVDDKAIAIAGRGFRDVTRIASGNPALWQQILLSNRNEIRASIHRLRAELDAVDKMIEQGTHEELEAWLTAAAMRRRDQNASPEAGR